MWKHRYAYVCALIAVLGASTLTSNAQSPDPSTLPLIQFADLVYSGAFRLPKGFTNGEEFAHGGEPIAFNPGRNSLFVGNRSGKVAEVSIPALVSSSDVTRLSSASYLQAFYEPTEGAIAQIPGDRNITGLLVMGENLYGSAAVYYDANNDQVVSHYARSATLSQRGVVGMKQVWADKHTGFVSGYMAAIPQEWQQKLGGPAATGQCCIPIAWRTSWGPSAFAFNPPDISSLAKVPASPLLYYADAHPTLGQWEGNGYVYSAATQITGMVFVAGSRTALYFGRTGTGPFCYGEGTVNAALAGTATGDGSIYCYDPTDASKGQHGYPYNYQIWAYDMNDLAAVKAGQKNPWDVRPYGVWPFTLPTTAAQSRVGGIGYDAARQIIYISQMYADQDTYDYRPIIHALKINGVADAPLPAPSTVTLPPVTVSTSFSPGPVPVTALAISANKSAPQPAGSTMTFTATPTGGVAPLQYKWLVHNGLAWVQMADWSTSNTFSWTPSAANSQYRVGVWVRGANTSTDVAEFTASMDYAVSNSLTYTAPYQPAKAVTISPDRAAPQAAGSMITFTAAGSGGQAPYQYKWLVHNGLQWNVVTDWSTASSFVWTPALVNSQYRIGVWVRSTGGSADAPDASSSVDYAINGVSLPTAPPPPSTTPPPTTSTGRITALTMTPNRPAPQPAGSAITFTATPTGGIAPHQYKWLVHNGLQWNEVAGWSTANTFTWTPASANSQYRVGVWVRQAGNTSDAPEFTQSMDYPVTAGTSTGSGTTTTTTPPPPATTTSARLTEVTLRSDQPAPQPQDTTITFTATPNGGAMPQQYKWLMHDGYQWKVVSDWGTSNTFNWTPTAWNSQYRFGVWVRSAGNTVDTGEATASMDFPITVATTPPPPVNTTTSTAPLTAVMIASNKVAPQPAGSMITFTAIPTGGIAQQYKWMVHDGISWSTVTAWSTSTTFNWTPPTRNSAYRIGVWARNGGNTVDAPQATYSIDFAITDAAAYTPPPLPPTTTGRLTDVALTSNIPAPQRAGTTIVFTATPNGGTAPQYKFLVHDGTNWTAVTGWSSANTFSWTPPAKNSYYRIGVWVRTNGSTADSPETTKSIDFPITP